MLIPETALEHEIKFRLPARSAGTAAALLAGHFGRDPVHPEGVVTSLYYDTPGLRHLREALDGMWRKSKFRVRGYDDGVGRFAERKDRVGTRRSKRRIALRETRSLRGGAGEEPPREFAILGGGGSLRPVFTVSYRRLRFVDPDTGARLSVDADIRAFAPHPVLGARVGEALLPHAVVEWKGLREPDGRLLRLLSGLGARRASFSKYAQGYLALRGRVT